MNVLLFAGVSTSLITSLVIALRSEDKITTLYAGIAMGLTFTVAETGEAKWLAYSLIFTLFAIVYEKVLKKRT